MTDQHDKLEPEGGSGYHRLKEKQSLGDILETAMSFERTARDFYTALMGRVSKPTRSLVEELAQEEVRHYELFKELAQRPDVKERISEEIRTPPSNHRFSDYIQIPRLDEFPDEQSILQYALGREQAAMEQYGTLAADTPRGSLQDLFRFLAQEELRHKGELEKRYYELVYSTGV
jgi:rubrerythrin